MRTQRFRYQTQALISHRDHIEQHFCARLYRRHITEFIKDQKIQSQELTLEPSQFFFLLQRRLGQNSTNSSRPPSTDGPGDKPTKSPRQGSGKKRSAQPRHDKADRTLIPTCQCDDVKHYIPKHCENCGQALIDHGGASAGVGKRLRSAGQELIHQWNRWRRGNHPCGVPAILSRSAE